MIGTIKDNRDPIQSITLREKCPYSELFWSAFSRIWTEYGEILCISPYLAQMWENVDQNNSKYGHFLCSVRFQYFEMIPIKLSNSKVYPGLKNTSKNC